ncbi:MAG: leucine-rich repeat domain-containing protein [Litoreibacter sp.]
MKHIIYFVVLAGVAFGIWQYPSWQVARAQLAEAEKRVIDVIAKGTNNLDFDDLRELRRLPANINEVPNLVYLSMRETNVSDLTGLEGNSTLEQLDLNGTRIADLTPLEALPELRLVYLHDTWVKDVSPLTTLPSLERLDIGNTQIDTLLPVTRMEKLNWLNLYKSHALDGSGDHFTVLEDAPFLELAGGSAYRQDYRPGWLYNVTLRFSRLKEQLGL